MLKKIKKCLTRQNGWSKLEVRHREVAQEKLAITYPEGEAPKKASLFLSIVSIF